MYKMQEITVNIIDIINLIIGVIALLLSIYKIGIIEQDYKIQLKILKYLSVLLNCANNKNTLTDIAHAIHCNENLVLKNLLILERNKEVMAMRTYDKAGITECYWGCNLGENSK